MCLGAAANADLIYTFETGTSGTDGGGFVGGQFEWFPPEPPYSGAVRQTTTAGGWTVGGDGPKFEFGWPAQSVMQGYANSGNGRVSFDFSVDDATFDCWGNPASTWYHLHYAGNSDGVSGWTQDGGGSVSADYNPGAPPGGNDQAWHFDLSFAQLGFAPGDTWFQIFFGSNSDSANAVRFLIDNVHAYVPEPGTLALFGLGAAAMLLFRRR